MSARYVTWDDGYGEPRIVPSSLLAALEDALFPRLPEFPPFGPVYASDSEGTGRLRHQYAVQPRQDRHSIRSRRGR